MFPNGYITLCFSTYLLIISLEISVARPWNNGPQHSHQGLADSLSHNGRTFIHDKGGFSPTIGELPVSPKLLCPKGYDLVGESCLFIQTVPPNVECPSNYEISKTENGRMECIMKILADAQFDCANGLPPVFIDREVFCPSEFFEQANFKCPDGSIKENDQCLIRDYKPPNLTCIPGYSLDKDGNCKQVLETKPEFNCPPNTFFEASTMTCIVKVIVEPLEVCPPGAIPVKSRDLSDMKSLLNKLTEDTSPAPYRQLQPIPTVGYQHTGREVYNGGAIPTMGSNSGSSSLNYSRSNGGGSIPTMGSNTSSSLSTYSGLNSGGSIPTIGSNSGSSSSTYSGSNGGGSNGGGSTATIADSADTPSSIYGSPLTNSDSQYYRGQSQISSNNVNDTFYQALYNSTSGLRNHGVLNEASVGDEIICLILQFADPHVECPPGLELTTNGTCHHYHSFVPPKACEGGIEPDSNNMCVSEKLLPAEVECPKDYTLNILSGMCVKKEEADLICPEGTTLNRQTLKCEVDPQCPEEYILNNSTFICEKESQVPPHPKCPQGTDYDQSTNSCKAKDAQLPLIMCPEGYVQEGEACVLKKSVPASFYCPLGYYQTNTNVCVKWYQDYMLQCPPFLELRQNSFALRQDLIPPPGAGRGPVLPVPQGTSIERKLQHVSYSESYTQREFFPTTQNQLAGNIQQTIEGALVGHSKVSRKQFEALGSGTPILIKSEKTRGMVCFGWGKRYKMIVNCPEGNILVNGKCVETRITNPDSVCVKGYQLDEIAQICVHENTIQPLVDCPSFTELQQTPDGNPTCVGHKRDLAQISCPSGFEWVAETFNCQTLEFSQPSISCIKGYNLVNDPKGATCKRQESIPPTPSCPPEYRYDDIKKICLYEVKLHDVINRSRTSSVHSSNIRSH
ncbi:uncharacterized protein CMU_023910 [Cryptosporidium muris RN66]|uniref:Oocyst wall protein n=1 Tax=Cryptosporidium muris (strain RN66) TaxID=441375 RepID=B6AC33_CRYMR|nr:uncharacterized protein CMU_023910 [Cryptosporidium muris RN66]EEA05386.1 hypothetical protein, conserved [Cryptosporidium muris RN66]|eukprot:XP_002139735.1 hypothetical protein [Cryptosporidium muris RN66]